MLTRMGGGGVKVAGRGLRAAAVRMSGSKGDSSLPHEAVGGIPPRFTFNFRELVAREAEMKENIKMREGSLEDGNESQEHLELAESVRDVVQKYKSYVGSQQALDDLRAERNSIAKAMKGIAKMSTSEKAETISSGKMVKEKISALEKTHSVLKNEALVGALHLPNWRSSDTPLVAEPVVLREVGNRRDFQEFKDGDVPIKDHADILETIGGVNLSAAATASGRKFAYLVGAVAEVEDALLQYSRDTIKAHGAASHSIASPPSPEEEVNSTRFTRLSSPAVVNDFVLQGCGFSPRGESSHIYRLGGEEAGKVLVGTGELPLAAYHYDSIIDRKSLPLLYNSTTPCFRREAGEDRGIYRLHQFTKLEMFGVTAPDQSHSALERILDLQETIFKGLELPYRVLSMPPHELGHPAAKKYDIEAWMPGRRSPASPDDASNLVDTAQGEYGEVSSASNCLDFQARRLAIRFRPTAVDGKLQDASPVHTVNGTGMAVQRTLVAILENGQQPDGSVRLPDSLARILGFNTIMAGGSTSSK